MIGPTQLSGFKVSYSHTDSQAIKTDAPVAMLWDLMRCLRQRELGTPPTPLTKPLPLLSAMTPAGASDLFDCVG